MGYYTTFTLDAMENGKFVTEAREREICSFASDCSEITSYMDIECFNDLSCDSMKWYSHDRDMLELSKHFPTVTFILYGEGEDHDDTWRAFYKNGEMELTVARIVFEKPANGFAKEVWEATYNDC